MAWLRVIPLLCCGYCCACISCMFIVVILSGNSGSAMQRFREQRQRQDGFMSRIPIVNNFLTQNSRQYDPEKDASTESCAICLVEFSVDDLRPIAELNCSNKHIFHLECLQGWVKHQDNCPMCRELIVKAE